MDDGYLDTGIKPNMGTWTAIWMGRINGVLEERHLIHDVQLLGNEVYNGSFPILDDRDGSVSTITAITGGFNYACTTVGTGNRPRLEIASDILTTLTAQISFNAHVHSGTLKIFYYLSGDGVQPLEYTVVEGYNSFVVPYDGNYIRLYCGDDINGTTQTFDVDISDFSIREKIGDGGDRYYIDGVLQTTPALPDPTQTIQMGAYAPIGNPDRVDTHEQLWEFWLTVQEPDLTPSKITNFSATDNIAGKVDCTWSPSARATSYDIYQNDVAIDIDVTSPYTDFFVGTSEYYVVANNSYGSTESNRNSGTGL